MIRKFYLRTMAALLILGLAIYGIFNSCKATQMERDLENQYSRAFYDLSEYMSNLEGLLARTIIISHPENNQDTLEQIWKQSDLAQENLSLIPAGQHVFAGTTKFLNQLSNLAYSANNYLETTGEIPEKYMQELINMHQYCLTLSSDIKDIESLIHDNKYFWKQYEDDDNAGNEDSSFIKLDKDLADVPDIVYDGQYSDHLSIGNPKALTGDEYSQEQAQSKMKEILSLINISATDIAVTGSTEGTIPCYNLNITMGDGSYATAAITKTGGYPLWFLWNKESNSEINISLTEAQARGAEFLEAIGFQNMLPTHGDTVYNSNTGNVITINYCYQDGNIKCYPDLIKLRIDATDGTVVGIESRGYINCHEDRDIPEAGVSKDKALAHISSEVTVNSVDMAIIPTNYGTEVLTYEINCSFNDKVYLVYINANTGIEEDMISKTN